MRPAEYEAMYRVEDTHWWYGALRRQVQRVILAERERLGRMPRVLDAGAGTGGMLARLRGAGELYGVEIAAEGLRFCAERGIESIVQGSVTALPFTAGSFDIVLSLDVLYHQSVPDDVDAAREHARVLRPGGLLVLNLPAYDTLRGAHDAAIHTARRYTRAGVLRLLKGAGLEPERVTHWNALLLPVAAAVRLLSQRRAGEASSDVHPTSPALNALLGGILRLETTWLRQTDLPFGLSIFAQARKSAG
jgi:SAM-dependent methyltransferase